MRGKIRLYNGFILPGIALGTSGIGYSPKPKPKPRMDLVSRAWRKFVSNPNVRERQEFLAGLVSALHVGFRLVDTSAAYKNEDLIAQAIQESGVSGSEIVLTGRISNQAQFNGPNAVRKQIADILSRSGRSNIDLLMFHWPVTDHYEDTWKVICDAYEKGLAKSIGVANCHQHHLERLMQVGMKPMLDQFEVHPLFTQKQLIKYCQDNGIVVESYSAIARYDDRLVRLPKLKQIAAAHSKTPIQAVLRWHIQQGMIPIVRSLNVERQKENINVFDFELTREEMQTIDGFNINARIRYDPDNCDFTIL